jgi:hypothetical protein
VLDAAKEYSTDINVEVTADCPFIDWHVVDVLIENIEGKEYDELYLSCLPATKWLINKNPEIDDNNTKNIMNIISKVKANFVVLISTIDVYSNKISKDNILITLNGTTLTYTSDINNVKTTLSTKTVLVNKRFNVGLNIENISKKQWAARNSSIHRKRQN